MVAEGVESWRGGPSRGGPTRYGCGTSHRAHLICIISPPQKPNDNARAQRQHSELNDVAGPMTMQWAEWQCGRHNDNTVSWMMTTQAQWQQHRPNNNNAGPTTTTQAQWQHQKPNNNAASPTMTQQAEWWCGRPNDDDTSPTTMPEATSTLLTASSLRTVLLAPPHQYVCLVHMCLL